MYPLGGSGELGAFAWGVPVVVGGVVHALGHVGLFVVVVLGSLFGHFAYHECAVAARDGALFVAFTSRASVADVGGVVGVFGVDVLALAIGAGIGLVQAELVFALVLRGGGTASAGGCASVASGSPRVVFAF